MRKPSSHRPERPSGDGLRSRITTWVVAAVAGLLLAAAATLFVLDARSPSPSETTTSPAAVEDRPETAPGTLELPRESDLGAPGRAERRSERGAQKIEDRPSSEGQLDVARNALAGVEVAVSPGPIPAPGAKRASATVGTLRIQCRRGPAVPNRAQYGHETTLVEAVGAALQRAGATVITVSTPRGCPDTEHVDALAESDVAIVLGAASGGGWRVTPGIWITRPVAASAQESVDTLVRAVTTSIRRVHGNRSAPPETGSSGARARTTRAATMGALARPGSAVVLFVEAGDLATSTDEAVLAATDERAQFAQAVTAGLADWKASLSPE